MWFCSVLVLLIAGAGCGDGDSGSTAGSDGFAAMGSLIPLEAVGDEPSVTFEHLAAVGDVGYEIPGVDDPDLVAAVSDLSVGTGMGIGLGGVWDGLRCTECDPDAYGTSFEEAMGFAPGAPDRVIVVGRPPKELALLAGGVDPDELAAAFDGDDTYTVERDGDEVRISSSCEPGEVRCTEPGPRDPLGRGLHLWSDGPFTAISTDPDLVDGVATAAESGDGAIESDHPLMTVLAAADELALVVGAGGVPREPDRWAEACGEAAGVQSGIPAGAMSVVGLRSDGSEGVEMVLAVDVADEAEVAEVAALLDDVFAGEQCMNGQPYADVFDVAAAEVDGERVSVSAEVIVTSPRGSDGAEAPRGSIWSDLLLKRELPYLN